MCINVDYEDPKLVSIDEKIDKLTLDLDIQTDGNGTMDYYLFGQSQFLRIFEFYEFALNETSELKDQYYKKILSYEYLRFTKKSVKIELM